MKKIWMNLLLILTVLTISETTVQAQNNLVYLNQIETIDDDEDGFDGIYKRTIDLNGDKKKDVIEVIARNGAVTVKINSVIVKQYKKLDFWYETIGVGDINKKDKYKEVFIKESTTKTVVYRYNGKTLKKYATGTTVAAKKKKKLAENGCFGDLREVNGKGNCKAEGCIQLKGANGGWYVLFNYKIKNKKLVIDNSKQHEVTSVGETIGYTYAQNTMYAYKYPRMTSNISLFVIKKNQAYKPLKIIFDKTYAYVYVQHIKTKKKGWVVLKKSNFLWRGTY